MDEYCEMKKQALQKARQLLVEEKFIECMSLERMGTAVALIMDAMRYQKRCDKLKNRDV